MSQSTPTSTGATDGASGPVPGADTIGKRVDVLDKGFIELLDFMPHPAAGVSGDLAIVNAARVSFMGDSKGDEKDKKLLLYLLRHRHTSPFEQVEFKFRVRAPVVTWWQWVRHRTFNMNAQSGRYVAFEENDFYVPDVWRKQSPSNKQASLGEVTPEDGAELTEALIKHYDHGYALYEAALAKGVARELARVFLPGFSVYYTWVVKVDCHNMMHFLSLRMAEEAQYEIRVYAQAIYEHFFKPLLPWTAEAFEQYVLKA
jgi:thymidylate synthase (FAD)